MPIIPKEIYSKRRFLLSSIFSVPVAAGLTVGMSQKNNEMEILCG
jgi:hypothetical protein